MERMAEIAHLIATQDNRCTAAPLFVVQECKRIYGFDRYWVSDTTWIRDGDEADAEEAEALERAYWRDEEVEEGWNRTGYRDEWVFVTACFTEAGCKEYLAANGHNHGETRIYAYGSFRNREWQDVRSHLLTLGGDE